MSKENQIKLKPKVDLVNKIERKTMPYEEFVQIPPVPFQRFTEGRAEQSKVKKALSVLRAEHLEVSLSELTEDNHYNNEFYPAGSIFISNGNTRKHFWLNGLSNQIPKDVYVSIYKFKTMDEMRENYNTFDSMNAVERKAEKLYGILARIHQFVPKCEKLVKGQFLSGLNLACFYYDRDEYNQPTVTEDSLPGEVALYIEELKALDSIIKTPKNWDQALICASLMALKNHGTKNVELLKCLDAIDRRAINTTQLLRDGATHICLEWSRGLINQRWKTKGTGWDTEGGLKQCTAFALYWMEQYIEGKMLQQVGYNWEKLPETYFDKLKNASKLFVFENQAKATADKT